ncbi:MAG: DUF2304 domain-containing protein [Oscillospiraceae bacterium]|nr:DUF2304 domain-containing protein [Oscillospiraceae bacterium]
MSSTLIGLLLIGSVFTFLFVMRLIRKSAVRIEDTFFWIFFSLIIIILAAFPRIPYRLAAVLGFQSPINLVYLVIIFVLIVNQFLMSLKISKLTIKQKELVQAIAINAKQSKDEMDGKNSLN